jgi:hypothetical protein
LSLLWPVIDVLTFLMCEGAIQGVVELIFVAVFFIVVMMNFVELMIFY